MKTSDLGLQLIMHMEGEILHPYLDKAGYVTVGYGHCLWLPNGKHMTNLSDVAKFCPQFQSIDHPFAKGLLTSDVVIFENGVNSLGLTLNQGQFDSLIDFSFNEGFGALEGSTLLKRIKAGNDATMITQAFMMWVKVTVNGKKVTDNWQVARRKTEALLFTTGQLKFFA